MRRTLGIFTAVTAAMLAVGVAWATDEPKAEVLAGIDVSAAAAADNTGASVTSSTGATGSTSTDATVTSSSSSTSLGSSTSTTTPKGSTSTTSPGSSSTSSPKSSTTFEEEFTTQAGGTFQVAPGVSVTVDVRAGVLVLLDVSAPGWSIDIEDIRPDRIRIEFEKSDAEARFEAEIDDGRIEVEIRRS